MPHILLLTLAHRLVRIVPSAIQRGRIIKPFHHPDLRVRQLDRQPRMRPREGPRQLRALRHIAIQLQRACEQRRQLALEVHACNRIRPGPPGPDRPIAFRHSFRRRPTSPPSPPAASAACFFAPIPPTPSVDATTTPPRRPHRWSAQSHLSLVRISTLRPRLSTIISSFEFSISSPKSIKLKTRDHRWP